LPRQLSYTDTALTDLGAARRWLTQPGAGPVARRRLLAILDAIDDLRAHPCRFPLGVHPGVRERLCAGGYRVLYRIVPDTGRDETAGDVRVLRVYGPGQNRRGFDPSASA
jgi:plasmid stabilization system protein ParE